MDTRIPSIEHRRTVSPEEYASLKRQLFFLRCDYATLLYAIRKHGLTDDHQRQANSLEHRIASLELRIAQSEPATLDEEPIRLGDIISELRLYARTCRELCILWIDAALVYILAKSAMWRRTSKETKTGSKWQQVT